MSYTLVILKQKKVVGWFVRSTEYTVHFFRVDASTGGMLSRVHVASTHADEDAANRVIARWQDVIGLGHPPPLEVQVLNLGWLD